MCQQGQSRALASEFELTKPTETEKIIKALPALIVEYAGKPYGNGKTISVDYSTFGKTFYLKNGTDNAETTWLFKSGEEIIKSFTGDLTSIDIDFTELDAEKLEVYHKTGMYFEVTQGERKVKVMVSTQKLVLEKLTIEDAKHPSRKATTGQTLYLVGEGKINANVSATGFKNPFTNPNLSWSFIKEGQSNPQTQFATKSNITYDFKANPIGINERTYEIEAQNAGGDDKSVKVVMVDEDRERMAFSIGSETFGEKMKEFYEWTKKADEIAERVDKIPFLQKGRKGMLASTNKLSWYWNVTPFEQVQFNAEGEKSDDKQARLYNRTRELSGGFEAGLQGTVEWDVISLTNYYKFLPIPSSWKDKIEDYVEAKVAIVGKADAGGEIKAKAVDKKWVGTNTWEKGKSVLDPAVLRLKAEFGAEAKVNILQDSVLFSAGAYATGKVLSEVFTLGYFESSVTKKLGWNKEYFRDGIFLEIKAGGYLTITGFKYEADPFYKRIKLIEK